MSFKVERVDANGSLHPWVLDPQYYVVQWSVQPAGKVAGIRAALAKLGGDDKADAEAQTHDFIWAADSNEAETLLQGTPLPIVAHGATVEASDTFATVTMTADISAVQKVMNANVDGGKYYLFFRAFNEVQPLVSIGAIALRAQQAPPAASAAAAELPPPSPSV